MPFRFSAAKHKSFPRNGPHARSVFGIPNALKGWYGGEQLISREPIFFVLLLVGMSVLAPASLSSAQAPAPVRKGSDSKTKAAPQSSLAGCIDQQEGKYVLIDDHTMSPVADLDADGFPTEGFAKYVGQKVTLRGISNPGSTRPAFKVRSIETISESCGQSATSEKK
jgi:hypothetical protein